MEMILAFVMNKFGLAAIIGALGGLAYIYKAVKSNVALRREQAAHQAAEKQAEATRQRAQAEKRKRVEAEQSAAIEQSLNHTLTAELNAEREQKTREEKINEQESSDLVGNGLDHLFDIPDGRLPVSDAGPDAGIDDAETEN